MIHGHCGEASPIVLVRVGATPAWRQMTATDRRDLGAPSFVQVRALVDTGAMFNTISRSTADRIKPMDVGAVRFRGVTGVGNPKDQTTRRVAVEVTTGDQPFELPVAVVEALDDSHDMLLGMDLLRRFVLIVNGPAGEVSLRRP
jgi:predicted aspartyl protease